MPRQSHSLQFDVVLAELEKRRETLKDELRAPETHDQALQLKRQLDDAIACLKWCELHQISPLFKVTVLPETVCQTPSSN